MKTAGYKSLGLNDFFIKEFMLKKLVSPFGISLLIFIAIIAGFLAAQELSFLVFAATAFLIGAVTVYCSIFMPLAGYYLITLMAFFAFYPNHIFNREFPISTLVEILVLFVFIGTMRSSRFDHNQKGNLFKSAVSIAFLIYTLYYIVELFNPEMNNTAGWWFSIKRYTVYILIYIVSYKLINTPSKFRFFLKFWVIMSFIAALYGCYQQWFGLLPMEMQYIQSDPVEFKLMNQGGMIRKFSFLSDVVSFGVLSGSMAVVALILAINEHNKKRKYQLFFCTCIMILGMLYSGTRTTTIILPAGMALYIFMTIRNKSTLLTVFFAFIVAFFVLFAPIDTPVLNRIRSTFNTNEASLNVRDLNRRYIQPYIYTHPLGGGVATSGTDGRRFNPGHPLAGFPPDSGLLKTAIELGWIGLTIAMMFYLIILHQGISYYFVMQNEEYKKYLVAILAALFSIIVTQYAQVSIGQIPGAFFFFSVISLITRLFEFDESENSIPQTPELLVHSTIK